MTQTQTRAMSPRIDEFVARLEKLDAGDRARLKRDAGKDLSEARSLGLFFRVIPPGTPTEMEGGYFLVASLFPLADTAKVGSLGDALRQARDPDEKHNLGLDRRIAALLDADIAQLAFRLRQAIRLLNSKGIGVNWTELTSDILNWGSPYRTVQKKWARAYFKLPARPIKPPESH